jgi:hypothetical protein
MEMTRLKPQEIADQLKMSLNWVYRNADALGAVRIGGMWIFTEEGLKNALQRTDQAEREMGHGLQSQEAGELPGRHEILQNQKRSYRMGTKQRKGIETIDENPNRHGFINDLQ